MHVRCDNQYKTGADRGNILGQLMLLECMGICILSPLHECEMRGSLVYQPIGKYFSILFKFSHGIFRQDGLVVIFFFFFLETFLECFVDHYHL